MHDVFVMAVLEPQANLVGDLQDLFFGQLFYGSALFIVNQMLQVTCIREFHHNVHVLGVGRSIHAAKANDVWVVKLL